MAHRPASPQAANNEQRDAAAATVEVTALIVAHHAVVYRYGCRLCGCPTDAEDLTQQTFLIAQQRLHQLREPARARAWLLAIVRSCFLKSLRKSRPLPVEDIAFLADQVADRTPAVAEIDREELAAALADLPDEFRLVLLMFYFEELSYQEISQQLEVPLGTVMSRLSRAKSHLRKKLTPAPSDRPGSVGPHSSTVRRRTTAIVGVNRPTPVRAAP